MKKSEDELKKENTTKYGEFVCTEYQWLPLEKQKEQADVQQSHNRHAF